MLLTTPNTIIVHYMRKTNNIHCFNIMDKKHSLQYTKQVHCIVEQNGCMYRREWQIIEVPTVSTG